MAVARLLPDIDTILKHKSDGWTHRRIGAEYGTSGQAVTIMIRKESPLTPKARAQDRRYDRQIPWRIGEANSMKSYHIRMLRVAGQIEVGDQPTPDSLKKFESWKRELKRDGMVVFMHPKAGEIQCRKKTDLVKHYGQPARGFSPLIFVTKEQAREIRGKS